MRYLSVCSGIEAATQAWRPLGWQAVAFSEIDRFPSAVLAHHYPHVPNWGDMTKFEEWPDADVNVLAGGTPCQSFSVAGLRAGLADPRGNLMLTYLAIARRYRPRWLVWENVPGVLSSNGGRDFGTFLGALGQLGYGFAYRVLDAQFCRTRRFPRAVPQRRRRVFVVAYLGDWRPAAAVLFDAESLRGNPAPRREAGQGIAAAVTEGVAIRGREGGGTAELTGPVATALRAAQGGGDKPHVITSHDPACTLTARERKGALPEADLSTVVAFQSVDFGADATENLSPTLRRHDPMAVAFAQNQRGGLRTSDVSLQLTTGGGKTGEGYPAVMTKEIRSADAYEADASSVLSTLRRAVGEKAFQQWGLGILAAFQSPEVLRDWMFGASLRGATQETRPWLDDGALPRAEDSAAGHVLRTVWEEGPDGRSPQGRGLAKQLAGKPGAPLSVLPHEGTPEETDVQLVRQASEGARLLRQTLSEVQEVGRPAGGKDQPEHTPWAVRRLTPREAERLMGFPDDFTRIPYRNKPADLCPDGPRYKALGNSWAVNCAEWIGERIQHVEAEMKETAV